MLHVHVNVHVYIYIKYRNAGLYSTGLKKTNDARAGPVSDLADPVQHFLVQYRIKIQDAGMPMPVLVSSMLLPSYADFNEWKNCGIL